MAKSNDFKISSTEAYWDGDRLIVKGINSSTSSFGMILKDIKSGFYEIKDSLTVFHTPYNMNDINLKYTVDLGNRENSLEITRFDKSVIAGKFSFVFKAPNYPDVVITSGRFDIQID